MVTTTTHTFCFTADSKWVDERAEDRNIVKDIGLQSVLLVLAMGGHGLLGSCSPFKFLNADVFLSIGKLVVKE